MTTQTLGEVRVTPAPPLTAEQALGLAHAEHERAQIELARTRAQLDAAISNAEGQGTSVPAIAEQLQVTRQTVYSAINRHRRG